MPTEQRVISGAKRPVGGIREGRGGADVPGGDDGKKKKGKKPPKIVLIIVAAVLVLALGAGAYLFVLKPKSGGAATPPPKPKPVPGKVLAIDPISVNLTDGHYLRLGLGLQLTVEATEAPAPAHALDLAIAKFSGHSVAEVSDPATREALKAQLVVELEKAYEGKVMDVYLTDYVTQ